MATPKGTRDKVLTLQNGCQVHVYTDSKRIVLQLRKEVPTVADPLATSFKVAVKLAPEDAIKLAGELLTVAAERVVEKPSPAKAAT